MQVSFSGAVVKQALGAGFNALVSLALVLWLARVMGVGGFGHYVAVLSGATVGLILLEGGWAAWLYRECAAGQSGRDVMAHGVAHIGWTTAAALLFCVVWVLAGKSSAAWTAAWVCMALVAVMNLISARLRGLGWFGREALWQAAGRVASALSVWALVGAAWLPPVAESVFAAWALGLLCVLGAVAPRWWVWPRWRGLWRAYPRALPFVVLALCMAWLLKGDMVLLGGWAAGWGIGRLDATELSYYAASTRLTEMGLLLFAPLSNVLLRAFVELPEPSEAAVSDQTGRPEVLLWRVMAVVWLCGASAVGAAVFAGHGLMQMLFGAPYAPAGSLLPWVLLMLPAACGNWVWVQWWIAHNAERMAAWCLCVAGLFLVLVVPPVARAGGVVAAAAAVAGVHVGLWLFFGLAYLRRRGSGAR